MEGDAVRIADMLEGCKRCIEKAQGRTRSDLEDEDFAIVLAHWVRLIGESSRRMSPQIKGAHPEVPWRAIEGMRHRIVHEYTHLDLDTVWGTVTQDVPRLIPQLEAILQEMEGGE